MTHRRSRSETTVASSCPRRCAASSSDRRRGGRWSRRACSPSAPNACAIREFRVDKQLSQEDLAHRAALHPPWISHLESGRENPSWATVRRLASALNITLADLAAHAEALEHEHNDISEPQ